MTSAAAEDRSDPGLPYSSFSSAQPVESLRAQHRMEPYWYDLHASGLVSWSSRDRAEKRAASGHWRMRASDQVDPDEAFAKLLPRDRLALLGAVHMWRTASAEQLASITGTGRKTAHAVMENAWRAGLVERGRFNFEEQPVWRPPARHTLYRPVRSRAAQERVSRLRYRDRVGITGGYEWSRGAQADRHNYLATELGIRVAEFCEIGMVLGEQMSGLSLSLAGDGRVYPPSLRLESRSPDLMLVRSDGLRIAVEITSAGQGTFPRKARMWADTLAAMDPRHAPMVVLFVETGQWGASANRWHDMRADMVEAARATPAHIQAGVAERMFAARWSDWFPGVADGTLHDLHLDEASGAGRMSSRFLSLAAVRPTGRREDRWRAADLLDIFDVPFEPAPGSDPLAVVRNSAVLFGAPHWLRDPSVAPDIEAAQLRLAGVSEIPMPPPWRGRPERQTNRLPVS